MSRYIWFLILFAACEQRPRSEEIARQLKKSMAQFLKESSKSDSIHVDFDVKDVIYFEDKNVFDCQFTVHMTSNKSDTTGQMRATISRDLTKVTRTW